MRKDVLSKSMLVATGMLVAASMAFAKFPSLDFGHSSKKSADVNIIQTARIPGGATLQPGEYKVALNDNSSTPEIGFYQNGKLVAQAPAKLVDQGKKFDETEVFYDTRGGSTEVITEMDLSGWREEVLFRKNNGTARKTN
jgi:hypothetical protein